MVMDATQPQQPSPQSVGREFVRQYYTLLNKAPGHLHRFYNNNSSFIHGESNLVVGQRDIHNRIQQLNFNDCHAKISQVDAQATLGNGVVVQVTGELSNDGQPMRRFTQTFVLAAQSPKKYYVHNDIFRYQDHLYTDDEGDGETRSENGDEHELPAATAATNDQQSQTVGAIVGGVVDQQQLPSQVVAAAAGANVLSQQPQPIQQQVAQPAAAAGAPQQIYYSLPATGASGRPVPVLPAAPQAGAVPLPAQFTAATANQQVQTTQLNGVVGHDELLAAAAAQQQTAAVAAPITSPMVQQSGTVPVAQAGTPTLQSSVGIVQVPAPTVIPGFQQSPLVAPQGLQQQQQQLGNTPMHLVIQPTANVPKSVDIDDNTPVNSISTNSVIENSSRSQSNVPVPKPPTPVVVDDFKTINEQQQQEKYEAAKQQQNEPKTYANLFKSTSSSPSGFVNAALQQQQQLQQQQTQNNVYHSASTSSATSYVTTTSTSVTTYTNSTRLDNNLSSNGSLPQRNNSIRNNNNNKDYEQRRPSNAQFGDNQQLFLGNIPHHASEDDLKGLFSRFGTVLELRILSKPANKLPPGVRNPLNYGFITFDDADSVQKCLSNCPLYFPENSPDAQKLNVEEKKPRPRTDLPPRQQIGGNNMNNNIGRNIGGGNGPQSRSITNSNSNVMRNNGTNGGISRSSGGGGGGPRVGGGNGGFQRNDRTGGASNGPLRGGGNNSQSGNTYGRR